MLQLSSEIKNIVESENFGFFGIGNLDAYYLRTAGCIYFSRNVNDPAFHGKRIGSGENHMCFLGDFEFQRIDDIFGDRYVDPERIDLSSP